MSPSTHNLLSPSISIVEVWYSIHINFLTNLHLILSLLSNFIFTDHKPCVLPFFNVQLQLYIILRSTLLFHSHFEPFYVLHNFFLFPSQFIITLDINDTPAPAPVRTQTQTLSRSMFTFTILILILLQRWDFGYIFNNLFIHLIWLLCVWINQNIWKFLQ